MYMKNINFIPGTEYGTPPYVIVKSLYCFLLKRILMNTKEYSVLHTHQTLGPVFINPVLTRTPPVEMETILVVHLARVVEAVDHLVTQGCASVASVDDALWNVKGEALAKPTSNKSSQDPHLIVLREVVCVVGKLSS